MDQTVQRLLERQQQTLELIASLLQDMCLGEATLVPKVELVEPSILKCDKHPNYGGIRKPRSDCETCWETYNAKH